MSLVLILFGFRRWVTVAGIRSTGVSSCLAIAQRVRHLVQSDCRLSPSLPPSTGSGVATWWTREDGSSVVLDGVAYQLTHPLSRLGLARDVAEKSKL